jgi:endonuclease-8
LKEQTARFVGQTIVRAEGNTWAIDTARLLNQPVVALRTWGKQFFIQMPTMAVRIHMLLFGTYRINEERDKPPRLSLHFADGSFLNFYACSVKEVDCDLDALYDWEADVMSDAWNPKKARKKLRANPDMLACDALLDQEIFSGVGNIIKNEVLFRIRLHPLSTMGALPPAKLRALVEQAREYSFELPRLEKGIHPQAALAGARQEDLPALPDPLPQGESGTLEPAQLLVRTLPKAVHLRSGR